MDQAYRMAHGRQLRPLYPKERIEAEVARLAEEINTAYQGEELLLVVVLKGALFFAVDLVRSLRIPVQMDFVKLASYQGTQSTGKVRLLDDLEAEVLDRNVLIVEDIVDTGLSIAYLKGLLLERGAKRLSVCALVDKKQHRQVDIAPDFTGISCNGGFLVGYGLDLDERLRELPAIYEVVENTPGGVNDTPM